MTKNVTLLEKSSMRNVHQGTIMSDHPIKYFNSPPSFALLSCCFFGCTIFVFTPIYTPERGLGLLISGGFVLVLLVVFSIRYYLDANAMQRKYDIIVDEIVSKFVSAEVVDSTLRARAQDFKKACEEQVIMQVNPDADLSEANKLVKAKKEEFWDTHKLAKKLGFAVADKVGDYLLDKN